jgi:hypothetical protein
MEAAIQTTPLLEAGIDAVKQASTHLEGAGITSSFSMAKGCKPGS